jgi:hypothetical protein
MPQLLRQTPRGTLRPFARKIALRSRLFVKMENEIKNLCVLREAGGGSMQQRLQLMQDRVAPAPVDTQTCACVLRAC